MQNSSTNTPVPAELRVAEFVLRPLCAADAERDFEAVMANQVALRQDNGNQWPRPDFTVAENRTHLQGHEADFQLHRGFTYTVLDPGESRCLGCVYIYPPCDGKGIRASARTRFAQEATYAFPPADAEEAGIRDGEAEVRFWVRADGVALDLDRQLLEGLVRWLRDDFPFKQVRHRARADDARRGAILREAGLRVVNVLPLRDTEAFIFA